MRKLVEGLIIGNLVLSLFLFINKWALTQPICITCSNNLKTSHLFLSLLSFLGGLMIYGMYLIAKKQKYFLFICVIAAGIFAMISATLMNFQMSLGEIICWPCFVSEVLYYLVFIAITVEAGITFLMPNRISS